MFLKVFRAVRNVDSNIGKLDRVTQSVYTVNHVSKRNAGHSEWANRKGAKEASAHKKNFILTKLRSQLRNAILKEKNANPALNPRLQAVLSEAKKASIPQATIDKMIKPLAATLNQDNIISFSFSHSLGISCIVEISSIHPNHAKSQVSGVMRKFGFKYDGDAAALYKLIGFIYGKKSENIENAYDTAVEDAIKTNCEEVFETEDGNFSFICNPQNLEACKKSLSDLGYNIDYSETQYQFPTHTDINDAVSAGLEQMEDKLGGIPGFIKISYNGE